MTTIYESRCNGSYIAWRRDRRNRVVMTSDEQCEGCGVPLSESAVLVGGSALKCSACASTYIIRDSYVED